MTVRELREALTGVDENLEVVLRCSNYHDELLFLGKAENAETTQDEEGEDFFCISGGDS